MHPALHQMHVYQQQLVIQPLHLHHALMYELQCGCWCSPASFRTLLISQRVFFEGKFLRNQ